MSDIFKDLLTHGPFTGSPGLGKSKALKKFLKKAKKQAKKFSKKRGLKLKRIDAFEAAPADMLGFMVPPVTHPSNPLLPVHAMDLVEALASVDTDQQPITTLTNYIKWAKDIIAPPVTPPSPLATDRVTQVGNHDAHSPSWHLDAYLAARKTYHELLAKADDFSHEERLDDALRELDRTGTVINRLFGSSLVDGVWDKSKD